jgi:hypothetical protein
MGEHVPELADVAVIRARAKISLSETAGVVGDDLAPISRIHDLPDEQLPARRMGVIVNLASFEKAPEEPLIKLQSAVGMITIGMSIEIPVEDEGMITDLLLV